MTTDPLYTQHDRIISTATDLTAGMAGAVERKLDWGSPAAWLVRFDKFPRDAMTMNENEMKAEATK